MHYRQTVLVSMLAAAVTLAGVACACAVPAMDAGDPVATHHGHHEDGQVLANMDCGHTDCGDCMALGAVSKPDAVRDQVPQLPQLAKVSLDDDGQTATAFAAITSPLRGFSFHPPLPRISRTADTPVRRFDKLLS